MGEQKVKVVADLNRALRDLEKLSEGVTEALTVDQNIELGRILGFLFKIRTHSIIHLTDINKEE